MTWAMLDHVSSTADRIRTILTDKGWSARELSRRAGFNTPSQLSNVLKNLDRDEGAVERSTLLKIAQGAGVSERWLVLGVGTPDSDDVQTVSDSHKPELRNLPGWAEAERLARQEHADWPEWVWEATAISSPFEAPSVSLALVEDVARLVMRHRSPAVQAAVTARRAELADAPKRRLWTGYVKRGTRSDSAKSEPSEQTLELSRFGNLSRI